MEEKRRLVIIDTENVFLQNAEAELLRRYADKTELRFITEKPYAAEFFAEKKDIDVIVTGHSDYGEFLQGQDTGRILIVENEVGDTGELPDNVEILLQYMPDGKLISRLDDALYGTREKTTESIPEEPPHNTRVIGVFSPIGGCGKSLVSYALAKKLKKLDQKVLLVGCDPTQSVSVYYPGEKYAKEELAEKLLSPGEDTYRTILQNVEQDEISYLLPFEKNLPTLEIGMQQWELLLGVLKEKRDFDWLIMDMGSLLDRKTASLMTKIDYLILLTETNYLANRKMQKLLKDPDLLPKCECFLIANEYRTDGMHIGIESVFGVIAPYPAWEDALEDPVFYQIALKVTE